MSNKDKVEKVKLDIKNYGKIEIEKFVGKPNANLILFKEKFEFFAAMAGWDEQEKVSRLFMSLDGPPFRLVHKKGTIQNADGIIIYQYDKMWQVLIANYCNTGMYSEQYQKLLSSKMLDGHSLEAFDRYLGELIDTINGLAANHLGTHVADNIKELVFMNGILEFIAKQIRLDNKRGYDDCFQRAKEVAVACKWSPKRTNLKGQHSKQKNTDSPINKTDYEYKNNKHSPYTNLNKNNDNFKKQTHPPCKYCNYTNHSSEECRRKPKDDPMVEANYIIDLIRRTRSSSKNTTVKALFDSGAQRTLLIQDFYKN